MKISIPHQLSQEEAQSRIRGLIAKTLEEQKNRLSGLEETWTGNTGSFSARVQGFDLSGTVTAGPHSVDIEAKLPFALSFFEGSIRKMITEKATEILA